MIEKEFLDRIEKLELQAKILSTEIDLLRKRLRKVNFEENEELRKLNKANADNYVRWRDKKEEETENHIRRLLTKNEKLSQCLDEIKHILKVNKRELDECLCNDIDGQILQKIEEVKGNR